MHAVSVESEVIELRNPVTEVPAPESVIESRSDQGDTELNRWTIFLAIPFVLSAVFFMAAISTGQEWLIGGTLVTGPGLLIMAFIHLSLSSDTNGDR
jgi:hypothetical protein